ncbi:PDZ domain-containing protein [Streptomyces sp. P38-E01]|uniref:PDZ domain-containing protein n=1 Tax=Streptomyces tardus TaxID=2780544 RepID=A0A949JER1_9ACTN|nr:S41 family peptidase [Streptomyces tardus]MBU7598682.1 PDZ domain-containing protein [Streptomyces tardus]
MSGTWMFVLPRRIGRGAGIAFVFAGVLLTGFATGSWSQEADGGNGEGAPIRPRTLADAPIPPVGGSDASELVSRSGDRWSAAYSAREYEGLRQALEGEYVGVGIAVRRSAQGVLEVARVTEGSPADRAGIRRGDLLRTVDGEAVAASPVTEVVALLRGGQGGADTEPQAAPGSEVELGLSRDGRLWEHELRRAELRTESVSIRAMAPDCVRITVGSFTKGTAADVREAVRALPEGTGVLLDLRGNAGGLLHEAAGTAGVFLDGGVVGTYDEGGTQRALRAERGGDTRTSLVVLVDGGSMSAAELVAGALQDRGRALVVGTRTFGKGTVQMPRKQPDGSVAELTVGRYTTPTGRELDGVGLAPDVTVREGERATAKARTVLSGLSGGS